MRAKMFTRRLHEWEGVVVARDHVARLHRGARAWTWLRRHLVSILGVVVLGECMHTILMYMACSA